MIYFLSLCAVIAVAGLAAASAAQDTAFMVFGYALFVFGVGLGFFLLKKHFDAAEAARH